MHAHKWICMPMCIDHRPELKLIKISLTYLWYFFDRLVLWEKKILFSEPRDRGYRSAVNSHTWTWFSGHEINYDEVFWHSLLSRSITIQESQLTISSVASSVWFNLLRFNLMLLAVATGHLDKCKENKNMLVALVHRVLLISLIGYSTTLELIILMTSFQLLK